MPSNHTTNYQLSQWEADDRVLRTDFNADNAKIDAALGSLERTVTAHAALLPKLGNCSIETLCYNGDGTTGKDIPKVFTFSKPPQVFFGSAMYYFLIAVRPSQKAMLLRITGQGIQFFEQSVEWVGNQFKLYGADASYTLNISDMNYRTVAFIAEDKK